MILIPVILSGGAGSRLWPLSRETHPKPFLKLADGHSLLQKTFQRAAGLPEVKKIITVTNRELYFKTEDEYAIINKNNLPLSFILEPFGRNTAPAIATAALKIQREFGDQAIMLVLPADHLLENSAFAESVLKAINYTNKYLVTFGIKPTYPETGFGYFKINTENFYEVDKFVEKPDIKTANEYLANGDYFWNSGMFCFQVGNLLTQLEHFTPEILQTVKNSLLKSKEIKNEKTFLLELDQESFAAVPDISIDYALMEKSKHIAAVCADMAWSDIGCWNAFDQFSEADASGNRIEGEALLYESNNCYIHSKERLTALVGVDNLIIVDSPDALLVAHRDKAQDVKKITQQLKELGHATHKLHRTVHRPWGTYTVLEEGENFKIKRIVVKPGATLSLQMHHHRSEHWVVVAGIAKVTNDDEELLLNTNESTFIPAGHKHRLENPGMVNLVLIEVQSGVYLGEDDIVRFEDQYGRV